MRMKSNKHESPRLKLNQGNQCNLGKLRGSGIRSTERKLKRHFCIMGTPVGTFRGHETGTHLQQVFGEVLPVVQSLQVGDELAAGHPLPHVLHRQEVRGRFACYSRLCSVTAETFRLAAFCGCCHSNKTHFLKQSKSLERQTYRQQLTDM